MHLEGRGGGREGGREGGRGDKRRVHKKMMLLLTFGLQTLLLQRAEKMMEAAPRILFREGRVRGQ